ncbi:MAG: phosphoglucomutase [Spirochaetaceae bacterium]|nr:phosphoglucomutase [Spirochaetaceae bacterium]
MSGDEIRSAMDRMILSASGWRGVFSPSGGEEDPGADVPAAQLALAALMADAFADWLLDGAGAASPPVILAGIDTRPTGPAIAEVMIRVLAGRGIRVEYLFIAAAPEIMAAVRDKDGFVYVSASHNPVGHNGVKFGGVSGGVLSGGENGALAAAFRRKCDAADAGERAKRLVAACTEKEAERVFLQMGVHKKVALKAYRSFLRDVAADETEVKKRARFFALLKKETDIFPAAIIADMNGSARCCSIDERYFEELGLVFHPFHDTPGKIVHGIIPEGNNLRWAAEETELVARELLSMPGAPPPEEILVLGYTPDCDGDRGNVVFYNGKTGRAQALTAQELFALAMLAELAWLNWRGQRKKLAVVVNCCTSLRAEEIAGIFGAQVFRAEVGEANVVELARQKRAAGWTVRILGEGSTGGVILHPQAVRDPLSTVTALLKLYFLRGTKGGLGLFDLWLTLSGRRAPTEGAREFGFVDLVESLPEWTTTAVTDERARMHIREQDHGALKRRFQVLFQDWWDGDGRAVREKYGLASWDAAATVGTTETVGILDFGLSGAGGLRISFYDEAGVAQGFIWMRGSGTEPLFRLLCDLRGKRADLEAVLLDMERRLLVLADAPIVFSG